ncbi:MAG: GT4 family glycosyltransferase PelF [Spirochaetales bacterium]|nr:GT4 family glycosyltransferase PelF [Spirochaetales bacterium]
MSDVCLILEGTYPFIRGGVSSWVHRLIKSLPDLNFTLLALSPSSKKREDYKYDIPGNVKNFIEVFLQDYDLPMASKMAFKKKKAFWTLYKKYNEADLNMKSRYFSAIVKALGVDGERLIAPRDLLYSKESWNVIKNQYLETAQDNSFIDFFWTWRFIHMPILRMLNIEIPEAKVYHSLCTGYAGLVGIAAKIKTGRPLILTEHGIYTKERQIEISRADWIYSQEDERLTAKRTPGVFKQMWIDNFITLGKLCYDFADEILTIYGGNKELEVAFGAASEKIRVIPNGVDVDDFSNLPDLSLYKKNRLRVALVGRVVPIKDIKTFIKACKIVTEKIKDVDFWVIGPTEEDKEYFEECMDLVHLLGLTSFTRFTGRVNVKEYYPAIDVMVLTSISEGQPLTILEGMCGGIAQVASDVGACSELLNGFSDEDKKLGPSGIITAIGKPYETAQAIMKILKNHQLRNEMGQVGRKRASMYYDQRNVVHEYRSIYEKYKEIK